MQRILLKHTLLFLSVAGLFFLLWLLTSRLTSAPPAPRDEAGERWLQDSLILWQDPVHQAIVEDVWDLAGNDPDGEQFVRQMARRKSAETATEIDRLRQQKSLISTDFSGFILRFLSFFLLFGGVLAISVWGAETLGLIRFIFKNQQRQPGSAHRLHPVAGFLSLFVLFSPGYLIAYILRPVFPTDSALLIVALGVFTNGTLAVYSQKYLNLLSQEFEKGYILAARIRNVTDSFSTGRNQPVSWKEIFGIRKNFHGHLLHHGLLNTRRQFRETVRELAAFTITSLIILEMALNIQGRYGYELLRQLLYGNLADVFVMMAGLFLMVKLTDVVIDLAAFRQDNRYLNQVTEPAAGVK